MNAPTTQASGEQRAAPRQQMILAQTRAELNMTLRRGESVLVTIIIPALLLHLRHGGQHSTAQRPETY